MQHIVLGHYHSSRALPCCGSSDSIVIRPGSSGDVVLTGTSAGSSGGCGAHRADDMPVRWATNHDMPHDMPARWATNHDVPHDMPVRWATNHDMPHDMPVRWATNQCRG